MHRTKNDLPVERRTRLANLLNDQLANLIDLHLQAKQAHWNVRGPQFMALHELFDDVADEVEEFIDMTAERITALGGVADGTLGGVVARTRLAAYSPAVARGDDHLETVSSALATVGTAVRRAIDDATELGDAATADLFTEIVRGIDKRLWFVEAHLTRD